MKVSEAEQLVCPFMAHTTGEDYTSYYECITTKCMAWVSKREVYDTKHFTLEDTTNFRTKEMFIDYHVLNNYEETPCLVFKLYSDDKCGYCQRIEQ